MRTIGLGPFVARVLPVFALLLLVTSQTALAEKVDCSGSKKKKQDVSRQAINPGDHPDRTLVQFVRIDSMSSKHPDFDGAEQTVYGHLDNIRGTGTGTGYAVSTLKSGEKVWIRWEGTHFTVPKGDAWESRTQGVYRYIAGTGKFAAIRGGGSYHGVVTPTGLHEEFVCEAEY